MRLLSSLVILFLVSIAFGACTNSAPEPTLDLSATITAQVQEELALIPTTTPLPTYTPHPTFTPYPTQTPAPTTTAYPTYTPAPTPEPLPTYTPYPSPTLVPTYTPYPTPPPEPTRASTNDAAWQGTGDWYRDHLFEQGLQQVFQELFPGSEFEVRMASLDADPSSLGNDLYLTLACVDSVPVGYINPYDQLVPANMDRYEVGIWDESGGDWVDLSEEFTVLLTDDGSSVYITNRAYLREIVRLLERASSGLPADQYFSVILYDSSATDVGYWSDFDSAGVDDALGYLGCF